MNWFGRDHRHPPASLPHWGNTKEEKKEKKQLPSGRAGGMSVLFFYPPTSYFLLPFVVMHLHKILQGEEEERDITLISKLFCSFPNLVYLNFQLTGLFKIVKIDTMTRPNKNSFNKMTDKNMREIKGWGGGINYEGILKLFTHLFNDSRPGIDLALVGAIFSDVDGRICIKRMSKPHTPQRESVCLFYYLFLLL